MIHGINNKYLYASTKLTVSFVSADGKETASLSGTGFFIKKEEKAYLLTNRHVVDIEYDSALRQKYAGYKLQQVEFDTRKYVKDNGVHRVEVKNYVLASWDIEYPETKEDDIACLYNMEINGDVHSIEITGIDIAMVATADFIENLSVCDFIAFVGFPANVYDKHNQLPILRSGVISSDPRLDYNFNSSFNGHLIAYEAFSTGGASGSPVFALQKGFQLGNGLKGPSDFYREPKLVGINAANITQSITDCDGKIIRQEHQQMSLMYKADQIHSLIEKCERVAMEKNQ